MCSAVVTLIVELIITNNTLEGKFALATAKHFVAEGAYVFITGRLQPELDAAVKEIGKNVTGIQSDASKLADIDRLFATIQQEKGHLDSVFANVGVGEIAPLGSITEEHFDKLFNTNVKGLLFTVQKALPLLLDGASIILNASIVSIKGTSLRCVYSGRYLQHNLSEIQQFPLNYLNGFSSQMILISA